MRGLIAALCLLACAVARAEPPDPQTERARAHVKAAIAYYDEGKYEDAVREMTAAYALKPLPDLEYNLAQCFERLNRLEEAAAAYEKYLAGKPEAPDRMQVQSRIENLRERVKAQAAGQALPAPTGEKVVLKTIVVYRDLPPPPGRVARWTAYGCFVLAGLSLGAGIAFAVEASQAADQVTHGGSTRSPPSFDTARSADANGKTDVIVSGVGFGLGAVALAGGVAMYLLGRKIDREAPKLTLAPRLSPAGGGLVVAGRF